MKYKQYQKMKDSGVEWIGEIPEHWEVRKLKHITNQISDGAHFTPTYIDDGINFLRVCDIHKNKINWKNVKKIPISEHNELIKRSNGEIGDILYSKNGTIGISKIIDWQEKFSFFVSLALIKTDKKIINSYFLKLFLDSECILFQINLRKKTTTVTNLHLEEIKEFQISLPPKTEQKQIYDFLQKENTQLDNLISKSQSQINLLQEKRQALINHAVTKGLDPNVPMKDSGVEWIGEIPEHWEVRKIMSVCELRGRIGWKGLSTEDYREKGPILLGVTNISKNFMLDLSKLTRISQESFDESPEIVVQNNDILLAKSGATTGKVCLVKEILEPTTVNAAVNIFRPDTKCCIPDYLYYFLRSNVMQNLLLSFSSTSAQPNLFQRDIKKLYALLPSKDESKQISQFLFDKTIHFDNLISKSQSQIKMLQEKRQALITATVTGKIDVRNSVA